jgi:hypothetical protein
MKSKHFTGALLAASFFTLAWYGALHAYEKTLTLTKADLESSGASRLALLFNIDEAKVTMLPSADKEVIVKAVVEYSDPRLEPTLDQSSLSGVYTANFESGSIEWPPYPKPPLLVHTWTITLGSYDTDTNLEIDLDAVFSNIDLGSLPLTGLSLNVDATSASIDFSTPIGRKASAVSVDCDASYLSMTNIGNTDFSLFHLETDASITMLDFQGAYSAGEHEIAGTADAAALYAFLPMDTGEHVRVLSDLSVVMITGEGWEKVVRMPQYKEYITEDYETQAVQLNLEIEADVSTIFLSRD